MLSNESPKGADRRRWLFGLWLAFALLTLALAYWGWYLQSDTFEVTGARKVENALFMTLRVFGLSDVYTIPANTGGRWQLILARWLGAGVFLSGLATAGLSLFRAQIAALAVAWRSGHILVIGDHEIAFALTHHAADRGLSTVHVTTSVVDARREGALISLPRAPGDDGLNAGGAGRAARVIIAETDIGQSVADALKAAERMKAATGGASTVAVHLDDPAIAERIHHAEGGIDLFAFSEAHAAARSVMVRHPPFLLAHRLGAPAIHILIIGFNELGQELARDLVLNSLGMNLGRPWITVIDPDAGTVRRDFLHRHPEFPQLCTLGVFAHLEEAKFDTASRSQDDPTICASYVCLRDSATALAAAIGLRESAIRHDRIDGPIFARLRSGGLMRASGGIAGLQPLTLYGFGDLTASAVASRALSPDPDAMAKAVHEGYSRAGGGSADPWKDLPEEMRVSNRRVVSHIPAKLATLGFDLEPWLATPDADRPWPPPLEPGVILFRDDVERTRMATLEHERWMADRRLNGWRQGHKRDNARKLHTNFVAFDDLPEALKAYDYQVVDWMDSFLPRRPGGLQRG